MGGEASMVDLSLFPAAMLVTRRAAFDLLGAPIGDAAHCNTFTSTERVEKASACLDAIADLEDPQVSFLLLRHCASFTKLVHSMRTTPGPFRMHWWPSTTRSGGA